MLKEEMKEIFVITVFSKFEREPCYSQSEKNKGKHLFDILNIGESRTWGWYSSYEAALEALENNYTDMWEYLYDYACIEGVDEGVIARNTKMEWFKFNEEKEGYEHFEIPENMLDIVKGYNEYGMIFG